MNSFLLKLRFLQLYREAGEIGIFRALFVLVLIVPLAGIFLVQKIAIHPYPVAVPAIVTYLVWLVHQTRKDYRFLRGLTDRPWKIYFTEYVLFTLPVTLLLLANLLWIHAVVFVLLLWAVSRTVPVIHQDGSIGRFRWLSTMKTWLQVRIQSSNVKIQMSKFKEGIRHWPLAIRAKTLSNTHLKFSRHASPVTRHDFSRHPSPVTRHDLSSHASRVTRHDSPPLLLPASSFPHRLRLVPKGLFEWQSGLRKNLPVLLPVYLAGFPGVLHIGFTVFAAFMLTLVITSFFSEMEPLPMLRAGEEKAGRLLMHRLLLNARVFALFLLPFLVIGMLQEGWGWYALGYYLAAINLLVFSILLKYHNYRPGVLSGAHQLVTTIVCLVSVILPVAILVFSVNILLAAGAVNNLKSFLDD